MESERIGTRIATMAAELADLLAEPFDALNTAERCALTAQWETLTRSQAVVGHRLVAGLADAPLAELGETSAAAALSTLLRISTPEAHRRIRDAADLAPRRALTGQVVEPLLARTTAAQARGQIDAEQMRIIRRFFDHLPSFVTYHERQAAETQLASLAGGLNPDELRVAADRLAMLLDQDGELADGHPARRRYLIIGAQQPDGMSPVSGQLTPQARAVIDAVFAKLAAPGMGNPDGEAPGVHGDPPAEAAAADTRWSGQRTHDALTAMGRALLASGQRGSHHGLPVTMIITTTLPDLQSGTGHAVTGGGSLLPMSEVIRQASKAHHYLSVFDKHTAQPLYLGRANRLACTAQRIMLSA